MSRSNQNLIIVAISSIHNLDKEDLPISVLTPILKKIVVNVAIIDADIYYIGYRWKKVRIFTISRKNLEF